MNRARLSPLAAAYFRREVAYLLRRNPGAARKLRLQLDDARKLLVAYPEAGTPTAVPGFRRFVLTELGYVLTYARTKSGVEIASMRHGRQSDLGGETDDD